MVTALLLVLQACENWCLTLREEYTLKEFWNGTLRKVFGLKEEVVTGSLRMLCNAAWNT